MTSFIRYSILFIITWLLLYVSYNSLSYRPNAFEADAYVAYTKSIAEDGDFNILNNRNIELNWVVTPGFNVPDMHDHGAAVFWAPGGLMARALSGWGLHHVKSSRGVESSHLPMIFFSTVFAVLVFSTLLFKSFAVNERSLLLILSVFLASTPLPYYALCEFTAADSICFAFAGLLVCAMLKLDFEKPTDLFLLGLLTGFSRVIKISFLFWWPLIFIVVLASMRGRPKSILLSFFGGLAASLGAYSINADIQFSKLGIFGGYDYDFAIAREDYFSNLLHNLVGPFGMFHQAPWLPIALAAAVFFAFKTKDRRVRLFSAVAFGAITAKFLYEGHGISAAETEFGFRRYTIDTAFLCYVLFAGMKEFPRTRKPLLILFTFTLIYNILYFFWYRDIDKNFLSTFGTRTVFSGDHILNGIADFKNFLTDIFGKQLFSGVSLMAALFAAAMIWASRFHRLLNFRWIGMSLILFYILLTGLNITFNSVNSAEFAASDLARRVVIGGDTRLFVYDEAVSEFARNLLIAKVQKNEAFFQSNKEKLLQYLDSLPEAVLSDPIGFIEDLKQRKYRATVFYPGLDVSELLEYTASGRYEKAFQSAASP